MRKKDVAGRGLSFRFVLITGFILGLGIPGALASSIWGHFGQSIYLFSVEMPEHAEVYRNILGSPLFSQLTSEVSPGKFRFDLERLNPVQKAFLAGAQGPDTYDVQYYFISWPVHTSFPQKMLDHLNQVTAKERGKFTLPARAFFFGWTFHYITDLVIHPRMNIPNKHRLGREYDVHGHQHVIYEGLIDRIGITYWFLKHPEKRILPSHVIKKAGVLPKINAAIQGFFNNWEKAWATMDGSKKSLFLRDALYDESLIAFVKKGIPEAAIMNGESDLGLYFPQNPSLKSSVNEAIRWWAEVMQHTPDGFRNALRKRGFACSLDYGNGTPTPEPNLSAANLRDFETMYNQAIGRHPEPIEIFDGPN